MKWSLRMALSLVTTLLVNLAVLGQAPVNDLYTSPTILTPGVTCTNVAGTVVNATATPGDPAINAATGYDVWYQFTATSVNPVINVSSPGANFTAPRIQVLSGTFGSMANKFNGPIATALTTPLSLVVGTTYYLRVYSASTTAPTTLGDFNICITDVNAPANDAFANVVTLTSGPTCVTPVSGTIANASPSAGDAQVTGCNSVTGDVWYTFTAQSVNPVISMTNIGTSITGLYFGSVTSVRW
ncbi:MAG: hypothetical protein EOP51_24885 [Sphingobacteriales bacterium]|nr:MAG: hypothetical protein EOP51_24885 [Sphingobacteriales bacterium]